MTAMEFVAACFSPANAFYTVLLLGMFLYWAMVTWGMLDLDMGNPDVDIDIDGPDLDADVDVDVDVDAEVDGALDADAGHAPHAGEGSPAEILLDEDRSLIPDRRRRAGTRGVWYIRLMRWLGIGRVPLMVFLSIWVPLAWCLSFWATQAWGRSDGWAFLALLLPVGLASVLATKLLTIPFGLFFSKANRPGTEDRVELAGEACRIVSLGADERYGQAELVQPGIALTINVRTRPGTRLAKGDAARVVEGPDARDVYLVEPL